MTIPDKFAAMHQAVDEAETCPHCGAYIVSNDRKCDRCHRQMERVEEGRKQLPEADRE